MEKLMISVQCQDNALGDPGEVVYGSDTYPIIRPLVSVQCQDNALGDPGEVVYGLESYPINRSLAHVHDRDGLNRVAHPFQWNPFQEDNSAENLRLRVELRSLQMERTCKVCIGNQINCVIIPCGHLVVCNECGRLLHKCPICRGLLERTVGVRWS